VDLELDDDTAQRINRDRSSGQPLDGALQEQMGEAISHDLRECGSTPRPSLIS
jgi:hypothetical protein